MIGCYAVRTGRDDVCGCVSLPWKFVFSRFCPNHVGSPCRHRYFSLSTTSVVSRVFFFVHYHASFCLTYKWTMPANMFSLHTHNTWSPMSTCCLHGCCYHLSSLFMYSLLRARCMEWRFVGLVVGDMTGSHILKVAWWVYNVTYACVPTRQWDR